MRKPLAIDLYAGVGGWTDGLLAEHFQVVGFDIERHVYSDHQYPAQLVLQDVRTLHGSQFRGADLIVASPPCQEFSWMAMPWSRAKAVAKALRGEGEFPEGYKGSRTVADLTALFDCCFRIQREACEAAGRRIPMVVENVRGAQPWVGRSRWNFGSYHLWGDVPALMPMTIRGHHSANRGHHSANMKCPGESWNTSRPSFVTDKSWKNPGFRFDGSGRSMQSESVERHIKNAGGSWFNVAHNTTSGCGRNPDGRKAPAGTQWFNDGPRTPDSLASSGSKSSARKAASALIAKIPFELARYIARVYKPEEMAA